VFTQPVTHIRARESEQDGADGMRRRRQMGIGKRKREML